MCRDKNLEGSPFCRVIVADPPLGPRHSLTVGSWPDLQYQAFVSSWTKSLKFHHKVIGHPIIFVSLLRPWEYLAMPVNIVIRRVYRLLMTLSPSSLHSTSRTMSTNSWEKTSCSVLTWFCHVLWQKCMVSSTVRFWWAGKTNSKILYCFRSIWHLWSAYKHV